jgi:hypothetical protein
MSATILSGKNDIYSIQLDNMIPIKYHQPSCLGLSMLESIATEGYVKKENMTSKQFYGNSQRLKAAGLVRRKLTVKLRDMERDGNYYEITSLGKLVYLAIKDIRKAAARNGALRAWDNIKNDSNANTERRIVSCADTRRRYA